MKTCSPPRLLACALLACSARTASAQLVFAPLGGPNWFSALGASAMSADGRTLVGSVHPAGPGRWSAFRWTPESGFNDFGAGVGEGLNANAVSADGHTIVGTLNADLGYDRARPYVWSDSQGPLYPGLLPGGTYGWAKGVSGDGSTVVGYGDSTDGRFAWKWEQEIGYTVLRPPAGYTGSWVCEHGISDSGSVIVGYGSNAAGTLVPLRWTLSGVEACPITGSTNGVSRDGRQALMVGESNTAMRWWDDGHIDDLGAMAGAIVTWPTCASNDGSLVAGSGVIAPYTGRAWIWTASTGVVNLNDYLPSIGVDISGWVLWSITSVTADGRTLCGWGYHTYSPGFAREESFLITIPSTGAGATVLIGAALALRRRRAAP